MKHKEPINMKKTPTKKKGQVNKENAEKLKLYLSSIKDKPKIENKEADKTTKQRR